MNTTGEYRFRTFDGVVFGAASAADVRAGRWYRIGLNPSFPVGECPSVYELPPPTPGTEATYDRLARAGSLPTHVFKYGVGVGDRSWRNLSRPGDAVRKRLLCCHFTLKMTFAKQGSG